MRYLFFMGVALTTAFFTIPLIHFFNDVSGVAIFK